MRFLPILLLGLAVAACNGEKKSTTPTAPGAPNVVLTRTQAYQTSGDWCSMTWFVKNVGNATAYHVSIQATTGTYGGSYTLPPQGETSITTDLVRYGCPVLQRISWSAQG